MTKEEKEHKVKLLLLIILLNIEVTRRTKLKNPFELIFKITDNLHWVLELKKVLSTPTICKN